MSIRHISCDIQGFLRNFKNKSIGGMLCDENGIYLSDADARAYLQERLEAGDKYIRGGNCDNFDPQQGCMGHEGK